MKRGCWLFLSAAALVVGLSGCETRVKDTLQQKLQARAEQGKAKLDTLLAERDQEIRTSLEKLRLEELAWNEESGHPLMKWRQERLEESLLPTLREMAPRYPGTELEKIIPRYLAFLETSQKYWKRYFEDKSSADLHDYYAFLRDYAAENRTGPFYDDALFEQVLLHASHLFDIQKIPPENRPTAVFRFWQLAFEFPSLGSEAFSPYIARLCEKRFSDFCTEVLKLEEGTQRKGECQQRYGEFCRQIPFECRSVAVMEPYYVVLSTRMERLKSDVGKTPYEPAIDYLTAFFQDRQERLAQDCEEYPVMPDSMAFLPASQRLELVMGPRGVKLGDKELATPPEGGTYELTEGKARGMEQDLAAKLVEIRKAGEPELKQGQIGVMAERTIPAGAVLRLAWAPMLIAEEEQSVLNQTIYLVGRRRYDTTNAKAATEILLVPQKDAQSISVPHPGSSASCSIMGYTGEPSPEMPRATAAVLLTGDNQVIAGKLNPESGAIDTPDLQSPVDQVDWFKLSNWASDQQDAVLFGVSDRAPYESLIRILGPLAFRCKKEDCTEAEPRLKPNVYLAPCN